MWCLDKSELNAPVGVKTTFLYILLKKAVKGILVIKSILVSSRGFLEIALFPVQGYWLDYWIMLRCWSCKEGSMLTRDTNSGRYQSAGRY